MSLGWLLAVLAAIAAIGVVGIYWLNWCAAIDDLRESGLGEDDTNG